jgi:hypothetical protein
LTLSERFVWIAYTIWYDIHWFDVSHVIMILRIIWLWIHTKVYGNIMLPVHLLYHSKKDVGLFLPIVKISVCFFFRYVFFYVYFFCHKMDLNILFLFHLLASKAPKELEMAIYNERLDVMELQVEL